MDLLQSICICFETVQFLYYSQVVVIHRSSYGNTFLLIFVAHPIPHLSFIAYYSLYLYLSPSEKTNALSSHLKNSKKLIFSPRFPKVSAYVALLPYEQLIRFFSGAGYKRDREEER